MKRSNRLILLVGLFLAVVAFVGVFLLLSGNGGGGDGVGNQNPSELPTVFAIKDIPLGTTVTADMVETKNFPVTQRLADAFGDTSQVVGEIARKDIPIGAQLTPTDFSASGVTTSINCPPTQRCIAVQVDQVTGVGTLIQPGDWVDAVVGFTADKFPVVTINPNDDTIVPVAGINATSVKLLLQGLQVVGTLLPPPPTDANGNPTTGGGTSLNGQSELVILSVSPQQVEVVEFAQLDGSMSLVLRSSKDFHDPNDPLIPVTPVPTVTTGVILKTLVDEYGVLVPQVVEAILPAQAQQ